MLFFAPCNSIPFSDEYSKQHWARLGKKQNSHGVEILPLNKQGLKKLELYIIAREASHKTKYNIANLKSSKSWIIQSLAEIEGKSL